MKPRPGLPNPVTSSPAFRRRRTIWFLLACIICTFVFFSSSISLYPSSLFGSSPAEPNSLRRDVLELHGLQHFVLNSGLSLHNVLYKTDKDRPKNGDGIPDTEQKRLDPTKEIDLKVYSSFDGDGDWAKHVRELRTKSPLVVFSKVRLCFRLNPNRMRPDGRAHPCHDPHIHGGNASVVSSPHALSFFGGTRS